MLHNIMKQYRRDFKKIPILRKLLKVHILAALLYRHTTPGTFIMRPNLFQISYPSTQLFYLQKQTRNNVIHFFFQIDTLSPSWFKIAKLLKIDALLSVVAIEGETMNYNSTS